MITLPFDNAVNSVRGQHVLTISDMRNGAAMDLERKIIRNIAMRQEVIKRKRITAKILRDLWAEYNRLVQELIYRFGSRVVYAENLTTDVGRSALMARLSGTTTYTGTVNYGALGTSSTSPVVGNTTLGAETYRKALSSGTFLSNVAYLENFYTTTEVTGTFQEYGFFIDGTGSANTGQLWNRFTSTVVKSNVETLNVQSTITCNSV